MHVIPISVTDTVVRLASLFASIKGALGSNPGVLLNTPIFSDKIPESGVISVTSAMNPNMNMSPIPQILAVLWPLDFRKWAENQVYDALVREFMI